MNSPAPNELIWLVKRIGGKDEWLGFVRMKNGGAYILAGPNGSHMTGHAESWNLKYQSLLTNGYLLGGKPRMLPSLDSQDMDFLRSLGIELN